MRYKDKTKPEFQLYWMCIEALRGKRNSETKARELLQQMKDFSSLEYSLITQKVEECLYQKVNG